MNFAFRQKYDWIAPALNLISMNQLWGVVSKHGIFLLLCLLELYRDGFAPLMGDFGKSNREKEKGVGKRGRVISSFSFALSW